MVVSELECKEKWLVFSSNSQRGLFSEAIVSNQAMARETSRDQTQSSQMEDIAL